MAKEEILIRCINTATQRIGMKYPAVANNKGLMLSMGWLISDPQYEDKMYAIKNNKPFSENGQAKNPIRESFAPIIIPEIKPLVEEHKNEIQSPVIIDEPKTKRHRRTKLQIAEDLKQSQKLKSVSKV